MTQNAAPTVIPVGQQPVPVYGAFRDAGTIMFYNTDDTTNVVYLANTSSVGFSNSVPVQPLTPVVLDSSRQWYAWCPTGTANLVVVPGGGYLGPSPAQIAAQIAIAGINVTVTQYYIMPTGDPTGVKDTALAVAGLANGNSIQLLPGGTYYWKPSQVILEPGPILPQEIWGNGAAIYNVGPAVGPTITEQSNGSVNLNVRTAIHDVYIYGTLAPAGANGIQYGDVEQIYHDNVSVLQFTSGTALYGINNVAWTEQMHGTVFVDNCEYAFKFIGASSNSFDRMHLVAWVSLQANQTAVQWSLGAQCTHGHFELTGNFAAGATNTGIVWQFLDTTCNFTTGYIRIGVECDGTGVGHQTINFNNSANTFNNCMGSLSFINTTASFSASNYPGTGSMFGVIPDDDSLFALNNTPNPLYPSTGLYIGQQNHQVIDPDGTIFYDPASDYKFLTSCDVTSTGNVTGVIMQPGGTGAQADGQVFRIRSRNAVSTITFAAGGSNLPVNSYVLNPGKAMLLFWDSIAGLWDIFASQ
jgi:hypothetical protein